MLKSLALASAIMLIPAMSGPSASMQVQTGPTAAHVEEPPPEFTGIPLQPFTVIIGSPAEIHYACSRLGGGALPGYVILACTLTTDRVILFPNCRPDQNEYCGKLWRHEVAHLNGWRH